ncbi:MAG: hypothetical protein HZB59_04105 [Ignavibacteriales bacterium]|nr:hypothetical protein [Ignavibacteriales bacterium]
MRDSNGAVSSTYDYDAYGTLQRGSIGVNMAYRFTGQEFACPAILFCGNFDVNLYNFRARNYDSDLGIFYATGPARENFAPGMFISKTPPIANLGKNHIIHR